jgi:uncharacterized paraquat-inducible protein A
MTYDSDKLAAALDKEHPCSGDNTCDIAKAVELGCYLWAGHILGGATECELTTAAMVEINERLGAKEFEYELEQERQKVAAQPSIRCEACGSVVYTEADEDNCDNCLADVKREDEEE